MTLAISPAPVAVVGARRTQPPEMFETQEPAAFHEYGDFYLTQPENGAAGPSPVAAGVRAGESSSGMVTRTRSRQQQDPSPFKIRVRARARAFS